MTWHINNRSGDGLVHHAADFKQWCFIDENGQILQVNHITFVWD
jgi:hypothetical protein